MINRGSFSKETSNIIITENTIPKDSKKTSLGNIRLGAALIMVSISIALAGCGSKNVNFKTADAFIQETGCNIDNNSIEYLKNVESIQAIIDQIKNTDNKDELDKLYIALNNSAYILENSALDLLHCKIGSAINENMDDIAISSVEGNNWSIYDKTGNNKFYIKPNNVDNATIKFADAIDTLQSWSSSDGNYHDYVTSGKPDFIKDIENTINAMAIYSTYTISIDYEQKDLALKSEIDLVNNNTK